MTDNVSDAKCGKCHNTTGESDNAIQCDQCNLWFHVKCANISIKTYTQLSKLESFQWSCVGCKDIISRLKEENNQIKNENEHFRHANESLKEENKNLKDRLIALEKKLEDIKIELKGDIINEVMEEIKEIEDKKSREGNLVLYNVPESTSAQPRERLNNDGNFCEKLFVEGCLVNRQDFTISNVIRLGKKVENVKPRPILVKLQSSREKWSIIKNARNLKRCQQNGMNKISIALDLTIKEREKDKELRQELKAKKESGDHGWFIKNGKLIEKNFHQGH